MPGLVPGIQVFLFQCSKAWMAGTSPAMTKRTWHELNVSAWSRIQKARNQKARDGFRRELNSCDAEHMPVICPTCQILFSKNDFAGNATRPRLDMRSKDISRELMAKYRIDIGRNFSMLVAMTAAAQTRRGLGQVPTQSVNLLDCRLKTANVLRHGLSIRLISHLEEVHGRN